MDSSGSQKDEIWFLRMCHHISSAVYLQLYTVYVTLYIFYATTLLQYNI